jgi:FlaA1/EpsC-like NDP-sugar epimerase
VGAAYGPRVNGDRAPTLAAAEPRAQWLRQQVALLITLDGAAVGGATLLAKVWSFGLEPAELQIRSVTIPYIALAGAIVPTWLAVLAVTGAYDMGPFGTPPGEYGRVIRAGANFLAVVAVAYFVLHIEKLTRGFLAATVPLAVLLTLGGRAFARWRLSVQRVRGHAVRRAVVVGSRRSVGETVRQLADQPGSGLVVVGACVPGPVEPMLTAAVPVPILGGTDGVLGAVERSGADVVIFTGSLALGRVRSLVWKVEGSGIDVFVVPTLTQQATQLDIRPVAGLPLVHVDQAPSVAGRPVGLLPPEPTPPRPRPAIRPDAVPVAPSAGRAEVPQPWRG